MQIYNPESGTNIKLNLAINQACILRHDCLHAGDGYRSRNGRLHTFLDPNRNVTPDGVLWRKEDKVYFIDSSHLEGHQQVLKQPHEYAIESRAEKREHKSNLAERLRKNKLMKVEKSSV